MGWVLVDCRDMISYEEEHPEIGIHSALQLREQLERFRRGNPSIIHLKSPSGETLIIAIGGSLAGLWWTKAPMVNHFRVSVNPDPLTTQGVDFREQGADTGFRPQYHFSPEDVIEEVVYFFQNQAFSSRMKWLGLGREDRAARDAK